MAWMSGFFIQEGSSPALALVFEDVKDCLTRVLAQSRD